MSLFPVAPQRVVARLTSWVAGLDELACRRGCLVLASVGLLLLVGVFLSCPGLFPAGVFEENARWQGSTPAGIRLVGDSFRYLGGAENLLARRPFEEKQTSYLGYVVMVALCQGTGLGLPGVVALQVLLGLCSLCCLYELAGRLGGRWVAVPATLLYAWNPEVAAWHTIIQTDSVYISCLLIVLWLYARAWERGAGARVVAALACTAVVFVRPNGWIVPPALGLHWVWSARRGSVLVKAALTLGVVGLLFGAALLVRPLAKGVNAESPARMLYQGEVLWGHAPWRLTMPPPSASAEGTVDGLLYALRHPVASVRLAVTRVVVLLARVRPGYSLKHTVFVLLVYPPLVLLAFLAIPRSVRSPAGGAMLAIIAGHVLTVALTFAHQDGRFFLYFLPELLIFAVAWVAGRLAAIRGGDRSGAEERSTCA